MNDLLKKPLIGLKGGIPVPPRQNLNLKRNSKRKRKGSGSRKEKTVKKASLRDSLTL